MDNEKLRQFQKKWLESYDKAHHDRHNCLVNNELNTFTGLLNLIQDTDNLGDNPLAVTDNQPEEQGIAYAKS